MKSKALHTKTAAGNTDRRDRLSQGVRRPDHMTLDEVDVSWEVGGDFHANGLLANLWLVPDLHNKSSKGVNTFINQMTPPRTTSPMRTLAVPPRSTNELGFVKVAHRKDVYTMRRLVQQLNTASRMCVQVGASALNGIYISLLLVC